MWSIRLDYFLVHIELTRAQVRCFLSPLWWRLNELWQVRINVEQLLGGLGKFEKVGRRWIYTLRSATTMLATNSDSFGYDIHDPGSNTRDWKVIDGDNCGSSSCCRVFGENSGNDRSRIRDNFLILFPAFVYFSLCFCLFFITKRWQRWLRNREWIDGYFESDSKIWWITKEKWSFMGERWKIWGRTWIWGSIEISKVVPHIIMNHSPTLTSHKRFNLKRKLTLNIHSINKSLMQHLFIVIQNMSVQITKNKEISRYPLNNQTKSTKWNPHHYFQLRRIFLGTY